MAFAPAMRWMELQTAVGQASAARLIAAIVLLAARGRWSGVSLAAAAVIIASFGLEGHTVSHGNRLLLAPLLLVHFAAICWWLGALYPLLDLTRQAPPEVVVQTVRRVWSACSGVVAALVAAGAVLLIALSDAELRPDIAYQQRFVVKLTLVAALLSLAAWNKLRLTPLLDASYASGAAKLRLSIRCEIAVALLILAATAWIIGTSPSP